MPATEVLVDGLDHPEGVAWDPAAHVLWAGGEDGQLYRVDVEARTWHVAARAPGFVLGLAVDGRGRVFACCQGAGSLCVLDEGAVQTLRDGFVFPNYPAFAPDGTLFVSDSGHWGSDDGRVYRLDPGRRARHPHRPAPPLSERLRGHRGRLPPLAGGE